MRFPLPLSLLAPTALALLGLTPTEKANTKVEPPIQAIEAGCRLEGNFLIPANEMDMVMTMKFIDKKNSLLGFWNITAENGQASFCFSKGKFNECQKSSFQPVIAKKTYSWGDVDIAEGSSWVFIRHAKEEASLSSNREEEGCVETVKEAGGPPTEECQAKVSKLQTTPPAPLLSDVVEVNVAGKGFGVKQCAIKVFK